MSFLKTTNMSTRLPSSLKHWWKMEETVTGSSVDVTDSVGGLIIPATISAGSGSGELNFGTLTDQVMTGTVASVGTKQFMFVVRCNPSSVFTNIVLGTAAGQIINLKGTFSSGLGSTVEGASSSVQTDPVTSGSELTLALIYDGTNIALYENGTIVGAADAYAGGGITLNSVISIGNTADFSGMALFVFDEAIPTDYPVVSQWLGEKWAANEKVMWPNWD